jgi:hypothetical protein
MFSCSCGSTIARNTRAINQHYRTAKHINFLNGTYISTKNMTVKEKNKLKNDKYQKKLKQLSLESDLFKINNFNKAIIQLTSRHIIEFKYPAMELITKLKKLIESLDMGLLDEKQYKTVKSIKLDVLILEKKILAHEEHYGDERLLIRNGRPHMISRDGAEMTELYTREDMEEEVRQIRLELAEEAAEKKRLAESSKNNDDDDDDEEYKKFETEKLEEKLEEKRVESRQRVKELEIEINREINLSISSSKRVELAVINDPTGTDKGMWLKNIINLGLFEMHNTKEFFNLYYDIKLEPQYSQFNLTFLYEFQRSFDDQQIKCQMEVLIPEQLKNLIRTKDTYRGDVLQEVLDMVSKENDKGFNRGFIEKYSDHYVGEYLEIWDNEFSKRINVYGSWIKEIMMMIIEKYIILYKNDVYTDKLYNTDKLIGVLVCMERDYKEDYSEILEVYKKHTNISYDDLIEKFEYFVDEKILLEKDVMCFVFRRLRSIKANF